MTILSHKLLPFQPLLKVSMSARDSLILVLRKAIFSRYSAFDVLKNGSLSSWQCQEWKQILSLFGTGPSIVA